MFDEPLYAPWLALTEAPHPMREEILASHETDWRVVVRELVSCTSAPIVYEKHISKHLLPSMDWAWLRTHRHAFLIRDPHEMLLSFQRKLEHVNVEETGLLQQVQIWQWIRSEMGVECPVVDAKDLLMSPRAVLEQLCAQLGVDWDPQMLTWEPGARASDGIWGSHWYDRVHQSTGFQPYSPKHGQLSTELERVHAACVPAYAFLHARRIRVTAAAD